MTEDKKARQREYSRKWRLNNLEKSRESTKKWRERNLERDSGNKRRWYCENKKRAQELNKTWREENKERLKEKRRDWYADGGLEVTRAWRRNNPERNLFNTARLRAKSRGVEFNIKMSDVVIPDVCPVFGCVITEPGTGATAPSIDRIDNNKGYLPDNIKVICRRAKHLKNGATIEEVEQILAYMKRERSYRDDQDRN